MTDKIYLSSSTQKGYLFPIYSCYPPAIGGKHLTVSQVSANGTRQEKPGLYTP